MSLVVHPHFHRRYSGATRHVEDIVPALSAKTETVALGWLRTQLPRLGWRDLLRRARSEPIVWHAHRVHELLAGLALRLVSRDVRLVWTRHSTGRPAAFTRLLARTADRIISVSPETADTLGLPSEIVGHGVDLRRFRPPPSRDEAWGALGLGGRHGIGVIGRIREDKGQGDFVRALGGVLPRHQDWRAVLVGLAKPKDLAWIEAQIAAAGVPVALAGEQPEVERWYQGLTAVVVPSHVESFGLTRLEAMAAGCCLITSRLNAFDREIEHGRTGLLFEARDTEALATLLEEVMRDPARARQIGQNAAEVARARFGIEHEAAALLRTYEAVLRR